MHEHGNQQFVVRPNTVHKNEGLTADEVDRLRTEQAVAGLGGVPWSVRIQSANHRRAWRGQPVRKGQQGGVIRAAKRGGRFKEFYKQLAAAGKLAPTPGGTRSTQNHHWRDDMPL